MTTETDVAKVAAETAVEAVEATGFTYGMGWALLMIIMCGTPLFFFTCHFLFRFWTSDRIWLKIPFRFQYSLANTMIWLMNIIGKTFSKDYKDEKYWDCSGDIRNHLDGYGNDTPYKVFWGILCGVGLVLSSILYWVIVAIIHHWMETWVMVSLGIFAFVLFPRIVYTNTVAQD